MQELKSGSCEFILENQEEVEEAELTYNHHALYKPASKYCGQPI